MFTPESEYEKYSTIRQSSKQINLRTPMQRSASVRTAERPSSGRGNMQLRKYYLEKRMSEVSPFRLSTNSPSLKP